MKYIRIVLWTAAALLCVQFITYFTLADRFLTHVAMSCRPEFTHFDNARFKWVCLYNVNVEAVDPDVAQDIKDAFEERYDKVYYDERDIPEELIVYRTVDGKQKRIGYKEGYLYSIAFHRPGFMNVMVSHHDYEASLAAYSRQAWYFWILFRWVRVHTCYTAIS